MAGIQRSCHARMAGVAATPLARRSFGRARNGYFVSGNIARTKPGMGRGGWAILPKAGLPRNGRWNIQSICRMSLLFVRAILPEQISACGFVSSSLFPGSAVPTKPLNGKPRTAQAGGVILCPWATFNASAAVSLASFVLCFKGVGVFHPVSEQCPNQIMRVHIMSLENG